MLKKKCFLLIMAVLSILLILGCNNDAVKEEAQEDDPEIEQIEAEADEEPRIITDHLQREVEIPEDPQRILALTRNFMEELFELGVTPVGKVEEYNNRLEGTALPSVSNQTTPNIEAIYELAPDLIFANTRQHGEIIDALEGTGAAVVFIDPGMVQEDPLVDRIKFMSEILNRQEEAEAYIAHLDQVSEELRDKISDCSFEKGLILDSGDKISAAQPTGFFGALLYRLGIENIVPAGLPGSGQSTWVDFDAETIIKEDPDLIMLRAASNDENEHKQLLENFLNNTAWQGLKAVEENKVFVLSTKISPGNISNEEALRMTVEIICPEGN
ncbi:ABC transporter substrate-binding protein [Candidatus Contubernalis alkaliaceticus]|uniref:ABC transporter substrate-binding protein n=1 Tax=Candidatus Contubernalis alkaliaceticus TaxID=338645 RepID=UPI001F4C36FA|nr:ABC transporter substrate-binding protein [Candidatus Contubernalis alkalaceticus]UNC93275.1 ABC transporter substrate-binding protein [Candidatus Contubernalis alkalaceticus]